MKCTIKSLLLSTFALFAVLFGSCIITSKNVSAVSDITESYQNFSAYSDIFPTCTSSCLDDYSYLLVSYSGDPGYTSIILDLRFDGSLTRSISLRFSCP